MFPIVLAANMIMVILCDHCYHVYGHSLSFSSVTLIIYVLKTFYKT